MKKIAIYGKGGIGKSTTTSNLSAAFSEEGLKVCQIGCDPKNDSTRLLLGRICSQTVLDMVRDNDEVAAEDIVHTGYNGIKCVEAGGPEPGVGCAGRGIIVALEKLRSLEVLTDEDLIMYDVLGDVVCGGFAVPIREGYATDIYIVSSGELMSLYAANNIAKGVKRFAMRGGVRLGGIIGNGRNTPNEQQLLQEFAKRLHTQLIAFIPRDVIVNKAENNRQTVLQYAPESAQAGVYRKLAHDIWHNENMAIPTPMSFEELEKLVAVIRSREISLCLLYQQLAQCKAIYDKHAETILGNMDSVVFLGGREASTIKEISENWLGKATISMQTDSRSRGQSESYSQNTQRLGRELMTPAELATMPGDKCILQLRGLPPFFSPKYDLKRHPNYRYTAEADKQKNAFDLDRLIDRRRRPGMNEECEVYEVSVPDEALTDEDEDILNYDDIDDPDAFA